LGKNDDVEHGSATQGVTRAGRIDVILLAEQRQPLIELGRRRIDDDIHIMGGARLTMETAADRSRHHVGNAGSFEMVRDFGQEILLCHRGKSTLGYTLRNNSSPNRIRISTSLTCSALSSGCRL